MGISIRAGNHSLHTKVAAYTVMEWCDPFEGRQFDDGELYDRQGMVDILQDAVVKANAVVPFDFDEAMRAGFLSPNRFGEGKRVDLNDFVRARAFLKAAADEKQGISGSY